MRKKWSLAKGVAAVMALIGLATLLLLPSPQLNQYADTGLGAGYLGGYDARGAEDTFLVPPQQNDSEASQTGSVSGVLVDEADVPIRAIEVELLPLDRTGDQQSYATKRDWTNAEGQYRFVRIDPGDYILAVQKSGAPDGRHPFAGVYYPGVPDESDADQISVRSSSSLELHPLRLHRIETVTLKINVEFEDGARPEWSNLLFHNLSFPNQAVIGDEAPGIEHGTGEFVLPVGFEYYARAKVDCDAGKSIETRESRPVQRLNVSPSRFPQELTFIIPGHRCPLWSPQ